MKEKDSMGEQNVACVETGNKPIAMFSLLDRK